MSGYIPLDVDALGVWVEANRQWRKRQLKVLGRFIVRQRSAGKWINFDAVADEYAKRKGSGDVYDHLREDAHADLIIAFLRGEFEGSKGSQVMFFDESLAIHADSDIREMRFVRRLPLEELERLLQTHSKPLVVVNSVLRHCWLPRALCRQWLEERGLEVPAYWLPLSPAKRQQAPTVQRAQNAKAAAEGATATDGTSCPVTRDDFELARDSLPLLVQWGRWKYGTGKVPSRTQMLKDFRADFGRVSGISAREMQPLRKEIADPLTKRGGSPTHRTGRDD